MTDVLMVSSVFNRVWILEPLGSCYLASVLRSRGFTVDFVEPTVEGLSPEQTCEKILATPSTVLGISILRDEQREDVLTLLQLRRRARFS